MSSQMEDTSGWKKGTKFTARKPRSSKATSTEKKEKERESHAGRSPLVRNQRAGINWSHIPTSTDREEAAEVSEKATVTRLLF